jgi:2-iminobutanoate/2-iminopropanoate deaminase
VKNTIEFVFSICGDNFWQRRYGGFNSGNNEKERKSKMTLKTVHTDKAPAAIGPYSQAVIAPPFVFVSGQLGMDPATGNLVGDDLESQARQALENVKQILIAAGSSLEQTTAVEVFLTDMGSFLEFNAIYAEYFSAHKPARAAIEVSALPKGGCVEIKCTALVG